MTLEGLSIIVCCQGVVLIGVLIGLWAVAYELRHPGGGT